MIDDMYRISNERKTNKQKISRKCKLQKQITSIGLFYYEIKFDSMNKAFSIIETGKNI